MSEVEGGFGVDLQRLDELARTQATSYQTAKPFPHIVIDDFVREELLELVLAEVSDEATMPWHHMGGMHQKKSSNPTTRTMGPATRSLINFINGQELIGFLEQLTGIKGLVADWQLAGGGIHCLRTGGFLNVHADFNIHPHLRLDRRINLLLYLNKDWEESFGGGLELWNDDMTQRFKSVLPVFNRCVIFNTTDTSLHGNPVPVAAPNGRSRLSLAFYYYTNGRPEEERSNGHMTLFRKPAAEETAIDRFKSGIKRWTPPAITAALERRRNR